MLFGLQSFVVALLAASGRERGGVGIARNRKTSIAVSGDSSDSLASDLASSTEAFSSSIDISPLNFDPSIYKAGASVRRGVLSSKGAILIDVENVRGKTGFALSHKELLHAMTIWAKLCQLQGQVTLVVDHGNEEAAYYLPDAADMAIVFAGPHRKADDVIAHDAAFLGQESDVLVVTADRGLIDRCRRSAVRKNMIILGPLTLLEDLEYILKHAPLPIEPITEPEGNKDPTDSSTQQINESLEPKVRALEHEIKMGAELLEAEAMLRAKSGVNNKRRGKLKAKVRSLREKLNKSPSLLNQVVSDVLQHGPQQALQGKFTNQQQTALLARWEKVRRSSRRKEKTGDRVILAEQWRRELQESYGDYEVGGKTEESDMSMSRPEPINIAQAHFMKYSTSRPDIKVPKSNSLRLVVISDTHGFEESLTESSDSPLLPEGDVLVHLGDFAVDGSQKKAALDRFDRWLAKQPHPIKLIVRGNHDPRTWFPVVSGATFLTKPTTLTVGNFVFAFVPYLTGGKISNRLMPRRCDVMCTHVPPKELLDRCYSGKHVGSGTLRKGVERMASKSRSPPALWLCGHIHEGRGVVRHSFSSSSEEETLVINAAQANAGMAKQLDHGPVVLQLEMDEAKKNKKSVEIIEFDNPYVFLNKKDQTFFEQMEPEEDVTKLLMAVDLGLRTGFALFNDRGELVHYENIVYENAESLRDGAETFMREWEDKLSKSNPSRITHISIEGADAALRDIWRELCGGNAHQKLTFVRPEEWRADLLSSKEKTSGGSSKEAARLVARQVVADCSGKLHEGKFQTDVAEAVLVGYHVCRRLGWIQREPAVRRYSNGKVIVPTAVTVQTAPSTVQSQDNNTKIPAMV